MWNHQSAVPNGTKDSPSFNGKVPGFIGKSHGFPLQIFPTKLIQCSEDWHRKAPYDLHGKIDGKSWCFLEPIQYYLREGDVTYLPFNILEPIQWILQLRHSSASARNSNWCCEQLGWSSHILQLGMRPSACCNMGRTKIQWMGRETLPETMDSAIKHKGVPVNCPINSMKVGANRLIFD